MGFMIILRDIFTVLIHILTDNYLKMYSATRMQFQSQRVKQYFALLEEYKGKTKNKVGGHHPE